MEESGGVEKEEVRDEAAPLYPHSLLTQILTLGYKHYCALIRVLDEN